MSNSLRCFFIAGLFACVLAGCTSLKKYNVIQHRDTDYLKAQNIPPLKIPPGVKTNDFKEKYPLPPYPPGGTAWVDLTPPNL